MSTKVRIYLDFNATAPLVPAARDAMVEAMADVGNPSSVHAEGRRMRDRVERARNAVAALMGRPREQIVFTSGGTEANWLGVLGLAAVAEQRGLPKVVATTRIEHPSLRGAIAELQRRGWQVIEVPHDAPTDVTAAGLATAGLVAVGLVNHELGTILRDAAVFDQSRQQGALLHLDAVQAAGKLDFRGLHADAIAISGHKIGGPQGIGALAISLDDGLPIIEAGHQERGRRPGTENTLGIIGFGAAAATVPATATVQALTPTTSWARVVALGDKLEASLRALGARIHGDDRPRIGGTINAAWSGALGESIVMALDLEGISVSTGAACTSGSIQPSAVLLGLGLSPEEAREGVRFSLGRTTTEDEIDTVIRTLPQLVERARRHR
jgi:cysteine desulfurase